jgi:hypothetical protein
MQRSMTVQSTRRIGAAERTHVVTRNYEITKEIWREALARQLLVRP